MADNGGSGFVAGLMFGGVLGFVAGVLLAPRSGEETRAILVEKGMEWRDRAEELTAEARERVGRAVSEGRDAARQARGTAAADIDDEFGVDFEDDLVDEPDDRA